MTARVMLSTPPLTATFTAGMPRNTASRAARGAPASLIGLDPGVQGQESSGPKVSILVNGVEEEHHTSCSTPYVSGLPAPLNEPTGDPSTNWLVVDFTEK